MKALLLPLLCLGSGLFFFRVDAIKVESWNLAKQVADPRVHSLIRSRDVRDILRLPSLETRRIRIHTKREPACRLPICNAQDIRNQLNQWTDSSLKTAPSESLTKEGYGRRRRSLLSWSKDRSSQPVCLSWSLLRCKSASKLGEDKRVTLAP